MVFNWYKDRDAQQTVRSLTAEVIQLYGIPIRYIPKIESKNTGFGNEMFGDNEFGNKSITKSNMSWNPIYGEDPLVAYRDAIKMKAFLENHDFYEGTHQIFNKFGFSMSDEITLSFEIENFRKDIKNSEYELVRPMEGDLVAFELTTAKNDKFQLFEIIYVNESFSYFGLGQLTVYKVRCKHFQYSLEKIETGDERIDGITKVDPSKEIGDNDEIKERAKKITNWNPKDPFKDIFN